MHGTAERKILVLWSDDRSPNLGVRALAAGAVAVINEADPTAKVILQDFAPNEQGFSLGRKSIISQMTNRSIAKWLREFDVVLDTGAGDSFTDIYGIKRLLMMTVTQRAAIGGPTKFVMLPQTIGPFRGFASRGLARRTVRGADRVYVRDSQSAAALTLLGRSADLLTTDLVFAIPKSVGFEERDVILNPSGLLWESNPHVDSEAYVEATHGLIDSLLDSGRSVTLMAHVIKNGSRDDDTRAIEQLRARYVGRVEYLIPSDLREARQALAGAAVVIGARMHACLNAVSQGVPAIPWAYSDKFAPLLNDLEFGSTVDLRSDVKSAVSMTLELLSDAAKLQREAEEAQAIARARIDELVTDLKEFIESA